MILGEMTHADKRMNPIHFVSDPADIQIQMRINQEISKSQIKFWPWLGLHSLIAFASAVIEVLYCNF